MKKTLAIILVAVMLISTLVSLVVPAAAEGEGDWAVYLTATAYDEKEPDKNPPTPGYKYDEAGFHTISPNYTNYNPKFTVVSKDQYNIQNFSMTVVVHDYCTTGDNWLSFSIWSKSNGMAQGYTTDDKYGEGWTSLIRPDAEGNLIKLESYKQAKQGRKQTVQMAPIDVTAVQPLMLTPNVNPETGDATFTLTVTEGVLAVNGSVVGDNTNKCLTDLFPEGLAYVAVTLHNTDSSGTYQPTISITEVNGDVPTGSDSAEPESKERIFGDLIPSDTVPFGQPAVWFDASDEATNPDLPKGSHCTLGYADNNKYFNVTADGELFYMQWTVPDEITYEASDFPFAIALFKNYCTCARTEDQTIQSVCTGAEIGSMYYCAGTVSSPSGDSLQAYNATYVVTPVDENGEFATEDHYTLVAIPIANELWKDRLHGVRLDFSGYTNYGVDGMNSFDIMGVGFFKTSADAMDFVSNYKVEGADGAELTLDPSSMILTFHDCAVGGHIDNDGDTYCDVCWEDMQYAACEHVDEDSDNLCDNCGADMSVPGGDETGDSTTEAPAGETTEETTDKPAENTTAANKPSSDDEEEDKKGCGSVVSMGALAIVAILGTGLVVKRKEN